MLRRFDLRIIFTFILFALGVTLASAQTAPVSGRVVLKKADNTTVPVEGALVEVFRIDVKSTLPSAKTDKKGNFSFAGVMLGGSYVLSISSPGAKPGYLPNVKAGSEKLLVTLQEGDGRRWTEQEIRDAAAGTPSGSSAEQTKASEDQQKAAAEYQKKLAEAEAKNKEIESKNVLIQRTLKEGTDAFNAKNYDLAVAKFNEGIAADPDFVGSAPILLNNKGITLKIVAVEEYNRGVKSTDPTAKADAIGKAKEHLEQARDAFAHSWDVLKKAPPANAADQANYDKTKYDALNGLADTYRILVITKAGITKTSDVKEAFDAYMAVETDPAKKAKAQVTLGDVMREANDSDAAIAAYRVALSQSPDNADALAGLGLSLFNSGVIANDKEQMQEGLNYMTKFTEVAPATHPLKSSVKDAVDYLKNQEKLAPQKVTKKKG